MIITLALLDSECSFSSVFSSLLSALPCICFAPIFAVHGLLSRTDAKKYAVSCVYFHSFFYLFFYQLVCIFHFHLLLFDRYIFLFTSLACMLVRSSWWCLLRRVHKIAKSAYDLLHFRLSVRPYLSVRPSVRMCQLDFYGKDIPKIL